MENFDFIEEEFVDLVDENIDVEDILDEEDFDDEVYDDYSDYCDDYDCYEEDEYYDSDDDLERDSFYALTDGMCGDYEDWGGDWDALDAWMGR